MALSTIQWTDFSFNPWIGCRKVAPECANCYAETLDRNRYSKTLAPGTKENPVSHWGSGPRHRTKTWGDPIKWNRQAANMACGDCDPCIAGQPCAIGSHRPRVFCASLADWLDDENVPIEWTIDLLELIWKTRNLDWLLLTKRPQNWSSRLHEALRAAKDKGLVFEGWLSRWLDGDAPHNVWIGVSAGADQVAALDIPADIHFLSCEPMLTEIVTPCATQFDWIIFGGESGSKARPMDINWIRKGVKMCRENGIAPFVKQLGKAPYESHPGSLNMPLFLKDSHGGEMNEWPEDLRIREFPST